MTNDFPCQVPCEKVIDAGEKIASMATQLEVLNGDMYNHGQRGVKTRLNTFEVKFDGFIDLYNERENLRDKASARFRWIATTIITLGMLLLAALQANKQIHQGVIHIPKIGVSSQSDNQYTATMKAPAMARK